MCIHYCSILKGVGKENPDSVQHSSIFALTRYYIVLLRQISATVGVWIPSLVNMRHLRRSVYTNICLLHIFTSN